MRRVRRSRSMLLAGVLATGFVLSVVAPAMAQFTISGTARDAAATPVAAVEITLADAVTGFPIGIPPTSTDSLGQYTIAGLPPGSYTVGFEPPAPTHLLPQWQTATIVASSVVVDAALQSGFLVSGTVRDTLGAPIAGIDLKVLDRQTKLIVPTVNDDSDSTGAYAVVLPGGRYDIKWRSVNPLGPAWVPVQIRDVRLESDTTLDVTMIAGVRVSGTVTRTGGTPVVNANLDFVDAATGIKLDTQGDVTNLAGAYSAIVPLGVFDILVKTVPAEHLLAAFLEGVPVAGDTAIDFVLAPGFVVSGTVRDPALVPRPGVDVDALDAAGRFIPLSFDITGPAGDYAVVVPGGNVTMVYSLPPDSGLAPTVEPGVSISADTVIDASLVPGFVLDGTVRDSGGLPLAGVDLDVIDESSGVDVAIHGDNTDVLGRYAFRLSPGSYRIDVEPAKVTRRVAERRDSVSIGADTTIDWTLVPGVRLYGTVGDSLQRGLPDVDLDAIGYFPDPREIHTPGDNTDANGFYEVIIPPFVTYDLIYRPEPFTGITDTASIDSIYIAGDLRKDVRLGVVIVTAAGEHMPRRATLAPNVPNPFNPSTIIRFRTARAGPVRLDVFDVRGARVRTLVRGTRRAGEHRVRWDGRDDRGNAVASGVYFYRLVAPTAVHSRRMTLVK